MRLLQRARGFLDGVVAGVVARVTHEAPPEVFRDNPPAWTRDAFAAPAPEPEDGEPGYDHFHRVIGKLGRELGLHNAQPWTSGDLLAAIRELKMDRDSAILRGQVAGLREAGRLLAKEHYNEWSKVMYAEASRLERAQRDHRS